MPIFLHIYRALAYITGVVLILLVFVAVPLRYAAGEPTMVAIVGTLHGFLYMAYVAVVLFVGFVRRWSLLKIVLVGASGTIPFCSFIAEHYVTRDERARILAERDAAAADQADGTDPSTAAGGAAAVDNPAGA